MTGQRIGRAIMAAGATTLIVGALLPWLTLFAGLQRYRGIRGLNGWLVVLAGVAILGLLAAPEPGWRWRPSSMLAVAWCLTVPFVVWLLIGLVQTITHLRATMLIPGYGPGLFVVAAGVLVGAAGAALTLTPRHRPVIRSGGAAAHTRMIADPLAMATVNQFPAKSER